jgi:hypothetical protein
MNIALATYPRVYVRPMEKQELELVTSTCTMSYNVLLHDCTRHTLIGGARETLGASTGLCAAGLCDGYRVYLYYRIFRRWWQSSHKNPP